MSTAVTIEKEEKGNKNKTRVTVSPFDTGPSAALRITGTDRELKISVNRLPYPSETARIFFKEELVAHTSAEPKLPDI